ncbi:MAG: response regulator [Oligoflexales bacterium]|nr:response regulator [Oligoflexales bacterium]
MGQKKILLVDDSSTARLEMGRALTESGFDIIEAKDGDMGLEKLNREQGIELILTDHYMEKMNGLDMVRKIRENVKFKNIPIIMLTSEGSKDMREESKQLGIHAWAQKPCSTKALVNIIQKVLNGNGSEHT